MIKTINISKFASGSWPDNIGDTTLFYSEGYTHHASDVSGLFLDNPPVLSPKHATLVWRYNADVDGYILIHVQGSHVVSKALGRIYPFRAGYEVNRDGMNAIGFNVTSLFNAVPRIASMPEGRVACESEVVIRDSNNPTMEARTLATHMKNAFLKGKTLYVALGNIGEEYFGDGVFNRELLTLTTAIDSLPLALRRYVSFGYCVDEHYADVLEGVMVLVYDKASKMVPPADALSMTWEQAVSQPAQVDMKDDDLLQAVRLPGEREPLLTSEQLKKAFKVVAMPVEKLRNDDWTIWRMLGNGFEQFSTHDWKTFRQYCDRMDIATKEAYARWAHNASLEWALEGFNEEVFNFMHYNDAEVSRLQKKALPAYLKERRYDFLFRKGMSSEVKEMLDGKFVKSLQLSEAKSVINWFTVFRREGCEDNDGVKSTFGELFGRLVVPELKTMEKVLECMRKYPFVPVKYYIKPPKDVSMPDDIKGLKPDYRKRIEEWVSAAASAYSFQDIGALMKAFDRVLASKGEGRSPEQMALAEVKDDALASLLSNGKDGDVLDNCERLLSVARKLPKTWDDFVSETLLPAVQSALLGGKKGQGGLPLLSKESLLDVSKWPRIAGLQKTHPRVFRVVKERLQTHFESGASRKLGGEMKEQFIYASSLKKEKKRKDGEDVKSIDYKKGAEEAYPIISLYISTIKKSNKNMSKELEHLFRGLRGKTRNWKRIRLITWVCTGIICALGGLVAGKYLFAGSPTQKVGEVSILWEGDKQGNLMSRLACLADWDSVSKVTVDTLEVPHLKLEKSADLLALHNAYYLGSTELADTAIVRAYEFNEKGEQEKMDSLVVTTDNTLLQSIHDKKYRIKDVTVKGKTIEINNATLLDNDSTQSTMDAKYYLSVVRYLSKKLPVDVNFAY